MLQAKDLRAKNITELTTDLKSKVTELKKESAAVMATKEKNLRKPRRLRKDLARILGVIREKQILEKAHE